MCIRDRLTLIKSGIFPYPEADQEIHRFTYALYPHAGDFRAGRVVQEAYDLNCPLIGWQTEGKQENGIGVWGDGENAVMRKTIAAFTGIPHTGFSPVSYTHLDVYKRQTWVMWPETFI